jgi:hypothetical protein
MGCKIKKLLLAAGLRYVQPHVMLTAVYFGKLESFLDIVLESL